MPVSPLTQQTTVTVVRSWFNGFAETAYELEDGTTLYISYSQDSIRIVKPETEVEG